MVAAGTEFELLLAVAAGQRPRSPFDRERLIAAAESHRLIPQLANVLGEPELARANAFRNLQLFAHLADVAVAFDEAGIQYVSLKGPVLAHQLYGDISMRVCEDIDILIRKQDLPRALELLPPLGYSTSQLQNGHFDREHDVACRHGDGTLLELHVALAQPHYSYEIDLDAWFGRSTTAVINGRRIKTLALEDAALFAIIHATKHAWTRLDFLAEMRAIEKSAVDWKLIEERAKRAGASRAVRVARELAAGAPRTAAARQAFRAMQGGGMGFWETRWFDLRIRERWSDRLRYASRLLVRKK